MLSTIFKIWFYISPSGEWRTHAATCHITKKKLKHGSFHVILINHERHTGAAKQTLNI